MFSVMACANCGHDQVDAYCSRCGQRAHRAPFALRPLVRQAVDDVFNLDGGLLHTVVALTHRPGRVISSFLSGRTRPFTNPAKYLFICVALATFSFHFSGLMANQLEWMEVEHNDATIAIEFVNRYFNIILILGVPFMAAFSRLFFWRAGYNIAEHLIFNVFIYAHQNLLLLASIPVYLLLADVGWYLVFYTLLVLLYYVWACRQFFRVGVFSAALRGTLITLCSYLVFWALIGLFFVLLMPAFST
jgi:hypothetical protein